MILWKMLQWTFWFVFSWIKTQKVIWELCYNLLRTVHILFPHGCTNLYADWGQCSHFFHTFFSTFSILKGFRGYAFLVFQSKSVSDTEHVFMDMLPIGMSSFEKHLFRFFTLKKLLFVNCCIVLVSWMSKLFSLIKDHLITCVSLHFFRYDTCF